MNTDLRALLKKLSPQKQSSGRSLAVSPGMVFAFASIIVIAADVWMVQAALRSVYQYSYADVGARTVQSTRVSFDGYEKAIRRITEAEQLVPSPADVTNPFAQLPRK